MPISDEDFEDCLKRLGTEDSDPALINRFRMVLDEHEEIRDNILEAWIMAYVLERHYPSSKSLKV